MTDLPQAREELWHKRCSPGLADQESPIATLRPMKVRLSKTQADEGLALSAEDPSRAGIPPGSR